ncbi:hypothetical protein H1R20_g6975, partial [Candolleomyces eurysporus]
MLTTDATISSARPNSLSSCIAFTALAPDPRSISPRFASSNQLKTIIKLVIAIEFSPGVSGWSLLPFPIFLAMSQTYNLLDRSEVPSPVIIRSPNRVIPKPNNIRHTGSGKIDQMSRVVLHPPITRFVSEIFYNKPWTLKSPVSVVIRHVYSRSAESYDVASTVPRKIGNETRVFRGFPSSTSGASTEILYDQPGLLEDPIPGVERYVYPGIPKAYEVDSTIPCEIGNRTWVKVWHPTAVSVGEVVQYDSRRLEGPVGVG